MSIATASTQNRIGIRTLGAHYDPGAVYRGPAAPRPRSANVAVHGLGMIAPTMPQTDPYRILPIVGMAPNPSQSLAPAPVVESSTPPSLNPNGTASQAPTGVVVSSLSDLGQPSIAQPISSAPTPTATAQIVPAGAPGYVVVTSGGGTVANPSPDYFAEAEAWLTNQSLINGVPNWMIAVGAVLAWGLISHRGKR